MPLLPFIYPNMHVAVRRVGVLFMTLALFSFMGGPLALFQGVAWARMLQEYSTQGSFSTAVQKTFSGKYRCSLCKRIAVEKQKEKKSEATMTAEQSLKASLCDTVFQYAILWPRQSHYPPVPYGNYAGLTQEPPTPCPRGEEHFCS